MFEIREASETDRVPLEVMYLEEVEDHIDRAETFAKESGRKF